MRQSRIGHFGKSGV